jgi:hypothetical protein
MSERQIEAAANQPLTPDDSAAGPFREVAPHTAPGFDGLLEDIRDWITDRENHDQRGRFTLANTAALTHGGTSKQLRALIVETPAAREALDQKRAAIRADLGEDTTTIRDDLITRYVELDVLAAWLAQNLVENGVISGRGRTRAAATLYLQVADRQIKLAQVIAQVIDLERRQKTVPRLEDLIAAQSGGPQP